MPPEEVPILPCEVLDDHSYLVGTGDGSLLLTSVGPLTTTFLILASFEDSLAHLNLHISAPGRAFVHGNFVSSEHFANFCLSVSFSLSTTWEVGTVSSQVNAQVIAKLTDCIINKI